ncbi:hypothetical protein MKX73_00910 [Solibacillus sp. FSL W7-1436]|uniref:hypothetical protein n=1 Tax=Solibacillus sp. FSL W7-1436 TaxID=2921705 RepID=UPI0030F4E11E
MVVYSKELTYVAGVQNSEKELLKKEVSLKASHFAKTADLSVYRGSLAEPGHHYAEA